MNHGSPEAVASGCLCPVMDNCNGKGLPGAEGLLWVINGDCPLHGEQEEDEDEN